MLPGLRMECGAANQGAGRLVTRITRPASAKIVRGHDNLGRLTDTTLRRQDNAELNRAAEEPSSAATRALVGTNGVRLAEPQLLRLGNGDVDLRDLTERG
jgi:hypothetical protein